ncbi:hypothetical protein ACIQMV_39090 [Streptomyces sp. NPDC091412]|uniref:hypothetical protein n=1 Tax=Streptomyces sp. NPDC091412 TaxID=3366002 RepID=UPI003812530E
MHIGLFFMVVGLVVMGWVTIGRRRGWKLVQDVGPYSYKSGMVQGILALFGGLIAVVVGLIVQ